MIKLSCPNGTTTELTYDKAHRVELIIHKDKNGGIIYSYAYEYDSGDKISKETIKQDSKTLVQDYKYDTLGQLELMHVSDESGKELSSHLYGYDHAGEIKLYIPRPI